MASSSSNVVGVHYRVGKKIGEGSFGVIFEGTNLLNNQQVAIKFVSRIPRPPRQVLGRCKSESLVSQATSNRLPRPPKGCWAASLTHFRVRIS
jgi:serine/threonine protein kinase